MANINDYLLWRGDIPICKDFKFNEIDSMIMARLSYLRFDKIEIKVGETIEDIYIKMKDFQNDEFLYNGDKDLITNLGNSRRFKDLVVSDYVKNTDKEIEKQFGAITVHLSENEMYISFIGTDSTINGWKEDFNMSFMQNVPCQIAGKEYVEQVCAKYPNKYIRIGGHSKGGNVAIYSAITSDKNIQDRIIKVYNYDGPGFHKDIINRYGNLEVVNKIETYIPQDSIIGRLLNHKEKTTITLSIEKGIYQHDIYSWQVMHTDLVKSKSNTKESENINKTISNWVENTTPEQRKVFIDSIFELFYSTNLDTFGAISQSFTVNIPKILKRYNEISQEDKKMVTQMIILFAKTYFLIVSGKI